MKEKGQNMDFEGFIEILFKMKYMTVHGRLNNEFKIIQAIWNTIAYPLNKVNKTQILEVLFCIEGLRVLKIFD